MRKAFVGLSTPIGFDYKNKATKAQADTVSSPNPILDSPFGLMLLFDEIIFLSRSLCPENMRHLPYVSFLDESGAFPVLEKAEIEKLRQSSVNNSQYENGLSFQESLDNAGVVEGMGVDNHSHGLKIDSIKCYANTTSYNLAVDSYICKKINDPSIELITNSRFQPLLETYDRAMKDIAQQSLLTQLLVIENIPNYLTAQGPYHSVIEEVRENQDISEFRKWIVQQKGLTSFNEVKEMKLNVENALRDAQERLFLKHCDSKRHYLSIGKAMLGDVLGVLCPITGTLTALAEAGEDLLNPQAMRWQGFLIGAKRSTRNLSKT